MAHILFCNIHTCQFTRPFKWILNNAVLYHFIFIFQEKFISLALAFKTDKMTLEKRIELHERSRDIAEQNVDKELEGLNEALKVRVFLSVHELLRSFQK